MSRTLRCGSTLQPNIPRPRSYSNSAQSRSARLAHPPSHTRPTRVDIQAQDMNWVVNDPKWQHGRRSKLPRGHELDTVGLGKRVGWTLALDAPSRWQVLLYVLFWTRYTCLCLNSRDANTFNPFGYPTLPNSNKVVSRGVTA